VSSGFPIVSRASAKRYMNSPSPLLSYYRACHSSSPSRTVPFWKKGVALSRSARTCSHQFSDQENLGFLCPAAAAAAASPPPQLLRRRRSPQATEAPRSRRLSAFDSPQPPLLSASGRGATAQAKQAVADLTLSSRLRQASLDDDAAATGKSSKPSN
jgi:hypothetical protein